METQILDYQRLQQSQLEHPQTPVEACVSVDETFFDQVVLVLLDLPSGFILVEEMSQDYRYETWQHHTQQALSKLGLNIITASVTEPKPWSNSRLMNWDVRVSPICFMRCGNCRKG
jgi:hypothetical protein